MRFYKLCGKLTAYIWGCFPSERCDFTNYVETLLHTSAVVSLRNYAILQIMGNLTTYICRCFPSIRCDFTNYVENSLRTSADVSLPNDAILQITWKLYYVHLRMFPFETMRFYKSRGSLITYICRYFPYERCDFKNHVKTSLHTCADVSLPNDAIFFFFNFWGKNITFNLWMWFCLRMILYFRMHLRYKRCHKLWFFIRREKFAFTIMWGKNYVICQFSLLTLRKRYL